MKAIYSIFIIVICSATLWAQAPDKISYQAVIRDADNDLVKEQPVGMQISIVQGTADGIVVYSEIQNPTTNANGLVSIEIGTGTTTDDFSGIDWADGPYFIKTEIDPAGGINYTITGTSQLLSVPYALHTKTFSGDMQNKTITNLHDPANTQDAATKAYVDALTKTLYQKEILELEDLLAAGFGASELFELGMMVGTMEQMGMDSTELADAGLIGTVTDIDGGNYKWVKIGTQVWMAEDLRTSTYNDNTIIPKVTNGTEWGNLSTGAYCWYDNDSATYENPYGKLYNWYAVETGNLCPSGWHVPTDAEWTTLTNYLGGASMAGGKLKETGTTHWLSPNTGATNESGFTALPGGARYYSGTFDTIGYFGTWWSSTETSTTYAWSRYMTYGGSSVSQYGSSKELGFSVRCVRD